MCLLKIGLVTRCDLGKQDSKGRCRGLSVNPKTLVEKFIRDSKGRSRLVAVTSVLAVFTVLITVGVLTFPAISISGSEDTLREQGIDITAGQTTEDAEVVAPPADEAPIVAFDEASQAPDAESSENVAEAITEETQIGDVPVSGEGEEAEGESEADAPAEGEATEEEATEEKTEASNAAKEALAAADLSSQRLIVGSPSADALAEETNVVASFDNIYLIQYASAEEAEAGFLKFFDASEYVTPDVAVEIAEGEDNSDPEEEIINTDSVYTENENPFAELETALAEETTAEADAAAESNEIALIALIDTGAEAGNNVVEAVSMLGENPADDNGHGQRMVDYIVAENEAAQILSIKALGKDGKGDVSAVVAAINYAKERGASIINLSASAYASEENAALAEAVKAAEEAGIVVVGAAGNNGFNAKFYIPGNIEEATIVGAADAEGNRIAKSNFGETVDYNVVAESTSEAAARMSGFVSANGEAAIEGALNQGLIFTTAYVAPVEEETPEAEDNKVVAQGDVSTWAQLKNAIENGTGNITVNITQDLVCTGTITVSGNKTITINGNGHNVHGEGWTNSAQTTKTTFDTMIQVNGGTVTIDDLEFNGQRRNRTGDNSWSAASNWNLDSSQFTNPNGTDNGYFMKVSGGNVTVKNSSFSNMNVSINSNFRIAPIVVNETGVLTLEKTDIRDNRSAYPRDDANRPNTHGDPEKLWAYGRDSVNYHSGTNTRTGSGYFDGAGDNSATGYQNRAVNSAGAIIVHGNGNSNSAKVVLSDDACIYNNSGDAGAILIRNNGTVIQNSGTSRIGLEDGRGNLGYNGVVSIVKGRYELLRGGIHNNRSWWFGTVNVANNDAEFVMGVLNEDGSAQTKPAIKNNTTLHKGGGVYVNSDNAYIYSGSIENNSAYVFGGGIYVEKDHVLALDSTAVTGNKTWRHNAALAGFAGYPMGNGGGYWSCNTGALYIDTNAVKIYGNDVTSDYTTLGHSGYYAPGSWNGKTRGYGTDFFSENKSNVAMFNAASDPTQQESTEASGWQDETNGGNPSYKALFDGGTHLALKNSDTTDYTGSSNLVIKGNRAPNGGGIASNGVLAFTSEDIRMYTAKLKFNKSFGESAFVQPIMVKATFTDTVNNETHEYELLLNNQNEFADEINLPVIISSINDGTLWSVFGTLDGMTDGQTISLGQLDQGKELAFSNWKLKVQEFIRDASGEFTIAVSDEYDVSMTDMKVTYSKESVSNKARTIAFVDYTFSGSVTNNPNKGNIAVNKVKEDGTTPLNGAGFTLYKFDTAQNQYVSHRDEVVSTDGSTVSFGNLEPGIYALKETTAPVGYTGYSEFIPFAVGSNGSSGPYGVMTAGVDNGYLTIGGQRVYMTAVGDGGIMTFDSEGTIPLKIEGTGGSNVQNSLSNGDYYITGQVGSEKYYLQGINWANGAGYMDLSRPRLFNHVAEGGTPWTSLEDFKWRYDATDKTLSHARQHTDDPSGMKRYLYTNGGEIRICDNKTLLTNATATNDSVIYSFADGSFSYTVANEEVLYDYTLKKVREGSNANALAGTIFKLYKVDGNATKYAKVNGDKVEWVDSIDEATPYTADNGGLVKFENIPAGTYYAVETYAPENYTKLDSAISFTIQPGATNEDDAAKTYNGTALNVGVNSAGQLTMGGKVLYADTNADAPEQGATISTTPSKYPIYLVKKSAYNSAPVDGTIATLLEQGDGNYYALRVGKDKSIGWYISAGDPNNNNIETPTVQGRDVNLQRYTWTYSVLPNGVAVLKNVRNSYNQYLFLNAEGTGAFTSVDNAANMFVANSLVSEPTASNAAFDLQVSNTKPVPSLRIKKVGINNQALSGATFELSRLNGEGTPISIPAVSEGSSEYYVSQAVDYNSIYLLRETTPPANHKALATAIPLRIDAATNRFVLLTQADAANLTYQTQRDAIAAAVDWSVLASHVSGNTYDTEGNGLGLTLNFTVENEELAKVNVTKNWVDATTHPNSVTVGLYSDFAAAGTYDKVLDADGNHMTAVLSESNNWAATFDNLQKSVKDVSATSGRRTVSYIIVENPIPEGFSATYEDLDPEVSSDGVTTYKIKVNNTPVQSNGVSVTVSKKWEGVPESEYASKTIEVVLKSDYAEAGTFVEVANAGKKYLSAPDWKATWDGLEKYAADKTRVVQYTVEEAVPAGYTPSVSVTPVAVTGPTPSGSYFYAHSGNNNAAKNQVLGHSRYYINHYKTRYSNSFVKTEFAYCLHYNLGNPPATQRSTEYSRVKTSPSDLDSNRFNGYTSDEHYFTGHATGDRLYNALKMIAFYGAGSDAAGLQAKYGLSENQFIYLTQMAVWEYTDLYGGSYLSSDGKKVVKNADGTYTDYAFGLTATEIYNDYGVIKYEGIQGQTMRNAYSELMRLVDSTESKDLAVVSAMDLYIYYPKTDSSKQCLLGVETSGIEWKAEITNTRIKGEVVVTKETAENFSDANQAFSFVMIIPTGKVLDKDIQAAKWVKNGQENALQFETATIGGTEYLVSKPFSMKKGESVTLKSFPVGIPYAICEVAENGGNVGWIVKAKNQVGVIGATSNNSVVSAVDKEAAVALFAGLSDTAAGTSSTVTFHNYKPEIELQKVSLEGAITGDATTAAEFTVTPLTLTDSETNTYTANTDAKITTGLTTEGKLKTVVDNAGYYLVEETKAPTGFFAPGFDWVAVVTFDQATNKSTTVLKKAVPVEASQAMITVTGGKSYRLEDVTSDKGVQANQMLNIQKYELTIAKGSVATKTFATAVQAGLEAVIAENSALPNGLKLGGAAFTFKDDTPTTHAYYAQHDMSKPWFTTNGWSDKSGELVTNDNGIVTTTITNILPGEYILSEVKSPASYESINGSVSWRISVDSAGNIALMEGGNGNADYITVNSANKLVGVENVPVSVELPSTGGVGTQVFAIIGGIMMLVAGALWVRRTGRQRA